MCPTCKFFSFQETDKTPVGIGNLVARLIFESCINDGMNLNGAWDISGNLRSANLLPFKGGLISESFSDSNLPKKVPNHYPEYFSPIEKMLRIVICHLFLEI